MSKKKMKVDRIFAYIAIDDNGDEGICAFLKDDVWMPMTCADWDRAQSLKHVAQQIADTSGKKIELVKLSRRSSIEEIKPREK